MAKRTPVDALGNVLETRSQRHPETKVTFDRPSDTWPEAGTGLDIGRLAELSAAFSGELVAAGVKAGDRVAIMKQNHFDIVVLSTAVARIGAVPALLSGLLDDEQVETMLGRLSRPWLLTDVATRGRKELARVDVTSAVHRTIVVDGDGDGPGDVPRADLRGAPVPAARPVKHHQVQAIYHTSGTTGVPKLVAHSAETHLSTIKLETRRIPVVSPGPDDRALAAVSWAHARCAGMLLNLLTHRPEALVLSGPEPTAEARELAKAFRPTLVEMLPNGYMLWEGLAASEGNPFAETRAFHNTFDAIHPRTVRRLLQASRRRFPIWVQTWGQSEVGAATAQVYTRWSFNRPASPLRARRVGRPLPFVTKVRVVDPETKRVLPPGRAGALEVSADAICRGYVGQEGLHNKRHRGRWWTMGDMGIRSRTGHVYLLDREVEVIDGVESGVDIEDILLDRLPELLEVVVVPDVEGRPTPFIATERNEPLADGRWATATRGLAPLAPRRQLPWDEFPRTATLKVRRHVLRRRLHETNGSQLAGDDRR